MLPCRVCGTSHRVPHGAPPQRGLEVGDVGIRPSRERTTAANAQHNTAVRSVIRTTGYIPGSLAGAHASSRSGPQTVAQRGAAGSRRATRARESALARRSRRRLRRSRRSATCGALARRPGRTACRDREVPGLGGRLQEPLPCRPLRAVGEWEGSNGGTSRHRVAAGGPVVRISTCHRVDLDVGLSGCVTESTRVANRGE